MTAQPSLPSEEAKQPLLSARQIGVAAAFGGAALAIVLAGLTIPIPGTFVVTDPRENFTTIGASLTGPIGGIIVGILAGIAEPGIPLASLLAHIIGGIYNGFVYKHVTHGRFSGTMRLVAWAVQVLVYYYVVVVPLFALGVAIFYPDPTTSFFPLLVSLWVGVIPEALLTTAITTLVMSLLPERFKRPLW